MFILALGLVCFLAALVVVGLLWGKSDGRGGPQEGDY